jgi:cathepsin D
MGFKSISAYNANPVFQTLMADGEASDPVFAFKLSSSGAELSVGGTDSSLYSGDFTYAKVEKEVCPPSAVIMAQVLSSVIGLLASRP